MDNKKKWYAIYTKPRWEKKVYGLLQEKGLDCYCPLNKVKKKWSDRIKLIEEPLFKSYVFVRLNEDEKASVRFVNGVVNYVYWLGKPAVIKDIEIDRIKRFLNEYNDVQIMSLELSPDTSVVIKSGVFMDKEARVIKDWKKRVELVIENLGCKLVAFVDKTRLEVVGQKANY